MTAEDVAAGRRRAGSAPTGRALWVLVGDRKTLEPQLVGARRRPSSGSTPRRRFLVDSDAGVPAPDSGQPGRGMNERRTTRSDEGGAARRAIDVAMVLPFATAIAALALGAVLGLGDRLGRQADRVGRGQGARASSTAAELAAACAPAARDQGDASSRTAQSKVAFLEKEVGDREARVKELEDEMTRRARPRPELGRRARAGEEGPRGGAGPARRSRGRRRSSSSSSSPRRRRSSRTTEVDAGRAEGDDRARQGRRARQQVVPLHQRRPSSRSARRGTARSSATAARPSRPR